MKVTFDSTEFYLNKLDLELLIIINSQINKFINNKEYFDILKHNYELINFESEYNCNCFELKEYINHIKEQYSNNFFDNYLKDLMKENDDDKIILETLLNSYSNINELVINTEFLKQLKIKLSRSNENNLRLLKNIKKIHDFVIYAECYSEENKTDNKINELIHLYKIGNFKKLIKKIHQ